MAMMTEIGAASASNCITHGSHQRKGRISMMKSHAVRQIIGCALLLAVGFSATAEDRPYNLVCFEESGLIESLAGVVNAQQFLRNDSILKSGSCGFAQVPSGSTARYLGIHATTHGFLYPIYLVTYATTGQRMYSADGIFRADQWKVKRLRRTNQRVIVPRRCDTLEGFISMTGRVPKYISVPYRCKVEIVE